VVAVTQDILDVAVLGCIYLLFAVGLSLTWGTIGILNFAHGAVFMFSAFAAHLVGEHVRMPVVAYAVIAAATGAVTSILVQLLVFSPIQRRARDHAAAEMQILIGGIGVASILEGIAAHVTKSGSFGFNATSQNHVYKLAGLRITAVAGVILIFAVAISVAAAVWIKRSRNGLALRTIGVDPATAQLMGIDQARLALGAVGTSGAFAGLAGALLTLHLVSIDPTTGNTFLVKAFAAIVLGGVGSVLGVAVGCLALAGVETFVILQGYGSWADAVAFGLIFVILLIRPRGIFGRREVRRA
jgi:branched-chain amino acid transport system permease protein